MSTPPALQPAAGQKRGSLDDEVSPSPLQAATSSSLSKALEDGDVRSINGNGMVILKQSIAGNEGEIFRLRLSNRDLQEKCDGLRDQLAEKSTKHAVAADRLKSLGPHALFKSLFTLVGGAISGFGVELYKSPATETTGISIMACGVLVMLLAEIWSVCQGFRKS